MKRKVRSWRLVAMSQRKGTILLRKKSLAVRLLNVNGYLQTTANDVEITMSKQDVDVMCIVETKTRREDKDKIKVKGFDVHKTRRSDADSDKQGGGLAILRRKDGIVFKRNSPEIEEKEHRFVEKERLWVTYDSKKGKTVFAVST